MIKYHAWKKKEVYHSKHIFYHSGVLVMPTLSCTVKTSSIMVVFLLKNPTTWVHGYSWSVQIVFQGLKTMSELVQVIIKTSWILVLHHYDVGDHIGGVTKWIASKIDFSVFPARSALLARAKFLGQSLITYKTFVFDRFSRMFVLSSKNALVEIRSCPPPTSVYQLFVLARNFIGVWCLKLFFAKRNSLYL